MGMGDTRTMLRFTEKSESDAITTYRIDRVFGGQTEFCEEVVIADSPTYGRMLFLDGELQSAAADEHIYHEALVHPTMARVGIGARVLVIGGGEGATVREVLKWEPDHVDWIDIDRELVTLCRQYLGWAPGVIEHPRVRYISADIQEAIQTLGRYDAIIVDLPDPDDDSGYLYSIQFWLALRTHLTERGRMVTHCGPVRPFGNIGEGFQRIWTTNMGFQKAGFYVQTIPSFQGEWGFWMWEWPEVPENVMPYSPIVRVADRDQIKAWANHTLVWQEALNRV
jgi:spermidine synthase